jgi:hypothetical protein
MCNRHKGGEGWRKVMLTFLNLVPSAWHRTSEMGGEVDLSSLSTCQTSSFEVYSHG